MKKLYLWNDLSLFFSNNLLKVDEILSTFLKKISCKKCEYFFINHKQFKNWGEKLDLFNYQIISIGTRPSLLLTSKNINFFRLNFKREFLSNGKTFRSISAIENYDIVKNLSKKNQPIKIIEDVCVTGSTLNEIADLFKNIDQKQITIELFAGNIQTLAKLRLKSNIQYNSYFNMVGEPIKESTLICLKDLLFEKLGDKKYIERIDLLKKFFFENTDELIKLLNYLGKFIE